MSMASEIDSITKKYDGLLLSSAFNHLKLQEYEQDLVERLARHDTIKLLGKTPTLLMYSSRYMFRNQILLYKEALANDFEVVCLALFTINRKSETLDFSKFHLITRFEWEKATITNESYRSFNTAKLATIDLTGQSSARLLSSSLAYSSDSIILEEEGEENETQEYDATDVPADQFSLFWLHDVIKMSDAPEKEVEGNEYIIHYVAFLIDVLVWKRYFTDAGTQLKKRMLHHYASVIQKHHSAMTFVFMMQMIEHSSGGMTSRAHKGKKDCERYRDWFVELSETRFYKQWLDAELFLFTTGYWHKDLCLQTQQLAEHVKFIHTHLPLSLHNNWLSYTINGRAGVYWIESSNIYQVCANWLFKPQFEDLIQVLPIEEGCVYMSTQLFQTIFMPTLYQCILEDTHRVLFYLIHGDKKGDNAIKQILYEATAHYQYKHEDMQALDRCLEACNLSSPTSLYDCVATLREGNVNSPATKKMLKKRAEFDLTKKPYEGNGQSRVPWYERVIVREEMPDIEDLGNRRMVPPCMLSIFRTSEEERVKPGRPDLGYNDRINIVRYLIDLAYTKKEVLRYLCLGKEQDASYIVEIANIYDRFSRRKRLNPKALSSQHHSSGCGFLINTAPIKKEKSFLKCVFAEAACKDSLRRTDFTTNEKTEFQVQCGATLTRPLIYGVRNPVQYTLSSM